MSTTLEKALDWGTAVNHADSFVYYYFYKSGEATPFGETAAGWVAYEEQQFRLAFDVYESFLDLHFFEAQQSGQADFNLVTYSSSSNTLGQMYPPGTGERSGFGYFNYSGAGWDWNQPGSGGLEQGGYGFITIIHELGHGVGLAHPHDDGGTSTVFPGVTGPFGSYGDFDLNQGVYTTMSYNDGWQTSPNGRPPSLDYGYQGTPMALDIAVLQEKYGANTAYHTGDNTYHLPSSNGSGTFYSCIWDAGGNDKIVYTGDRPATIDLRAATLRVEPGGGGFISYVDGIFGGFTIAHGVTIETAKGGSGDDYLHGNSSDNLIKGRGGHDIIKGGAGDDTLRGQWRGDTIVGGSGRDWLDGGSGDDVLRGNRGQDTLDGGPGRDTLKGGPGDDHFVFSDPPDSNKVDKITDFSPGHDQIWLSGSDFGGLGGAGTLKVGAFHVGSGAADAGDRIIYNDANGDLIYDSNGDASGGATRFAVLDPGLHLTHQDFMVIA
jgi:serralysin